MITEKFIENYEEKYSADTDGNIYSYKYGIKRKLKPLTRVNGYLFVCLCKNGKAKSLDIHRIIALTFIENLSNKPEVNHVNGTKTDNRISNLEWNTPKENSIHAHKTGLSNSIPVKSINKLSGNVSEFYSASEAERITGVDQGSITRCCQGKRKSAGECIWKHTTLRKEAM